MKLCMFRTVLLSIIRIFSLYTQQRYMFYRFADSLRAGSGRICAVPSWSCSQAVTKPVKHIPLLCVQWKTPDDGQKNCPKHVEFYSKNKFVKLVRLVGFIIRIRITLHLQPLVVQFLYQSLLHVQPHDFLQLIDHTKVRQSKLFISSMSCCFILCSGVKLSIKFLLSQRLLHALIKHPLKITISK